MSGIRITGLVVLATLLLPAASEAQCRWCGPYKRGIAAIEQNRFAEAIVELERAVAIDPRSEANKREEGTFFSPYFPYAYLAIAYAETKNFEKAKENLARARAVQRMPAKLQGQLADAERMMATLTADAGPAKTDAGGGRGGDAGRGADRGGNPGDAGGGARAGGAGGGGTAGVDAGRGRETVTAPRAEYTRAVEQAQAAAGSRQYETALKHFDEARRVDAAVFKQQGLQARRDEVASQWARQLADEGLGLYKAGRLNDAKGRLQQSLDLQGGQQPVQQALGDIGRREQQYQRAKATSEQELSAGNLPGARDQLLEAQKAHLEQFTIDGLNARLTSINARINTPGTTTLSGGNTIAPPSLAAYQNGLKLAKSGQYAAAEASYAAAVKADARNLEAQTALDNSRRFSTTLAEARSTARSGDTRGAVQRLESLRKLDAARFEAEKLTAELEKLIAAMSKPGDAGGPGGEEATALREALLALLAGDAKRSTDILEPAIAAARNTARASDLHAYLGVSYATRALTATTETDQRDLREKALAAFRQALAARKDYQLSPRIVSPRILALFNQAKQ